MHSGCAQDQLFCGPHELDFPGVIAYSQNSFI